MPSPYMYKYIYICIYTQPYDVLLESNSNELGLVFLFAYTHPHTIGRIFFVFILFSNAMYTNKLAHDVCARFIADEIFSGSFLARPRRILMCVFTEFLCVSQTIPLWLHVKKKKIKINPSTRNDIIPKKKIQKKIANVLLSPTIAVSARFNSVLSRAL